MGFLKVNAFPNATRDPVTLEHLNITSHDDPKEIVSGSFFLPEMEAIETLLMFDYPSLFNVT